MKVQRSIFEFFYIDFSSNRHSLAPEFRPFSYLLQTSRLYESSSAPFISRRRRIQVISDFFFSPVSSDGEPKFSSLLSIFALALFFFGCESHARLSSSSIFPCVAFRSLAPGSSTSPDLPPSFWRSPSWKRLTAAPRIDSLLA